MIHIEQIAPELTWRLRRDVLYPNKSFYDMGMEEDSNGYHFGAFTDNQLVGVVSLFANGTDCQFRKLAISNSFQNNGYGRLLLKHMVCFAKSNGAIRIWCNARTTAIGFYLKTGFTKTGRTFSKNGFDYEIMESFFDNTQ